MAQKIARGKNTNIVNLGDTVLEIISAEGKRADQTFFTTIRDYSLSGNQFIARRVYDEIKVTYEDGVKTATQIEMEKRFLNGEAINFGNFIQIQNVKSSGNTAQTQRQSIEVSKNGSVLGLNVGGLVSLAENVQERIATTDEPVVSILTDTVNNVNLNEIVTVSKSDLSTLTGKSVSDGFLKATITTGAPSGLNNALANAGVPQSKREAALKEASTQPATVVEVSVDLDAMKKISTDFSRQTEKTIRAQNVELGNPFGSFFKNVTNKVGQPLGGYGQSTLGLPNTNVLGTLIGKLLNVSLPSVPGVEMPSVPEGVVIPSGVATPPPIISSTGTPKSSTNISKVVAKPPQISPAVQNTVPPRNVFDGTNKWEGALSTQSPDSYNFGIVGGPEELMYEFMNATRPITTMVVHWSRTPTDLDWGSYDIGKLHTATQLANKPSDISSVDFLLALKEQSGLQFHYVIKRNGVIELGRPINIIAPLLTGFEKYAVHVAFVGGFNCPHGTPDKEKFLSADSFTAPQWKAFDKIVKAFDMAKNGAGEFIGFNQFQEFGMLGPGFNVQEYVQSKFGKGTVYELKDIKVGDALSPEEIINRKPQQVPVNVTPPNNPPTKTAPTVDELGNVIPTQAEIDAVNTEYKSLDQQVQRLYSEYEAKADLYEEELSKGSSEAELKVIEDEADDIYEEYATARVKKVQLRKRLIQDEGYIWLEKEKKWIHGSQYNDYF